MKTRNAIIGTAALGLAAITGCDAGDITMNGDAAYCVREAAANANEKTVMGIYVNAKFHVNGGGSGFTDIYTMAYGSNETPLFQMHYEDKGNLDVDYSAAEENLSVQGFVNDISIRAISSIGGYYEDFLLEQVDCETLDSMLNQ
ncbi:MAG: hypothetical protein WC852_03290 [Candidatus Nanoarchaeia archaeon]|jgi:hypothetical protein